MIVDTSTVRDALPHHEIGNEIGRGRFGVVVAARHRSFRRDDAIRFLAGSGNAAGLIGLDHPHLVRVYSLVERDGVRILVMERLRGGTLRSRVAPSLATCCAVGLAVAAGLAHAHDHGVVHGDLRLSDVLFAADGTPKLGDAGLAELGGTPSDDVHALGGLLYEMLTGRPPVSSCELPAAPSYLPAMADLAGPTDPAAGPTDPASLPGVPTGIAAVVLRALAADPADRPASAREFGLELAAAAADALEPGWLDDTGGVQVFLEPAILTVASRKSSPPAEPPRPQLDFGALTAEVPVDSTSGLWAQPSRRRRGRRRLTLSLTALLIAAAATAAVLVVVAPRIAGQPDATATLNPDADAASAPLSPSPSPSPSASGTESESGEHTAVPGPVLVDVAGRGTVGGLSADGGLLVLVDADRVVTTYDTATGATVAQFAGPPVTGNNTEVAVSPDGSTVVFATTTALVVNGRDVAGPAGLGAGMFGGFEFLDGGTSVVVVDQGRLAVFDTASGALVHDLRRSPTADVAPAGSAGTADVVADPAGRFLAVVTPVAVEFWDRTNATQIGTVPADGTRQFVASAAWRSDGKLLTCVMSGRGRATRYQPVVVDPAGGAPEPVTLRGTAELGSCAFDAAGTRLAARPEPTGADVAVWDLDSGAELAWVSATGEVSAAGLSADGRTLAVSSDRDVRLWTLPSPD